ncbi:FAD binding domain-containing protein [Mesorhizobium sp. SP-1A]|uniref:FAD binding domain-containing protein n=1 Tax=Mesorhizobium sp. SP-1A TaxID=3077840 RepID=UPI0028F6FB39|nr:FAD binding domain-containing protein [Mesorhizobium sp. SP-1A]
MKTAAFQLHKPSSTKEAVELLALHADEDGRVIAGGQSLVPSMMFRMAVPPHLIDINGIKELSELKVEKDSLLIGAAVRHLRFEKPVEPGPTGKLLARVVKHIAHYPIRTRGTFCGSLAQSDPSSEWCLTAATLGAVMIAQSVRGKREIQAKDYFKGIMETALEPDEILVGVRLPLLPDDAVFGFTEFSRRQGDYAMSMGLATWQVVGGVIAGARLGIGGAEPHPRRMVEAETMLNGQAPSLKLIASAAAAAADAIDPLEDVQADAEYRRDLVRAMARRAMEQCLS